MIIDMRYHLASLVAVFLALGLGILIGTSLSTDGRLVAEQANLLDTIEAQLAQFKNDKAQLELEKMQAISEIGFYREFAETMLPGLVSNQLTGVKVTLLDCSVKSSAVVEQVALMAGAMVTSIRADSASTFSPGKDTLVLLVGEVPLVPEVRYLLQELRQRNIRVIAVGEQEWLHQLNMPDLISVSRIDTAVGQVQLVQAIKANWTKATKE